MKTYYALLIVFMSLCMPSNGFSNGCKSSNINPKLEAAVPIITGNLSICLPGNNTTQLTASGTPSPTNPWTSSNPTVATVSNTGLVTGVNFGATTITFFDNLGNAAFANVYVSNFPTVTGTLNVCVGGMSQLSGSVFPNVATPWTSSNPAIATVDNTGLVTGISAGVCTITYMNLGGCTSSVQFVVDALLTPAITCGTWSPNQVTYSWTPVLGATTYAIFYSKNDNPFVFAGSGNILTYTILGVLQTDDMQIFVTPSGPMGSCFAGATQNCQAASSSCPNAGTSGSITVCDTDPATINLFDIITDEDPDGTWIRTSGSGGTFDSLAGTFIPQGAVSSSFMYTVTGTSPCPDDTSMATITVNAATSSVILAGVQNICVGLTTTYTSTVSGGIWTSSDPTIATVNPVTGVITGVAAGTATITYTLTSTGGCANATATRTVTVNAGTGTITVFCDPANVTSPTSVAVDWNSVPGATSYEYAYTINGGMPITGSTTLSHYEIFGVAPGQNIMFILSNAVGVPCFQSAFTTCSNLANEVFETDDLQFFPNPVKDIFSLTNSTVIHRVEIINMLGQHVLDKTYDSKSIQIDLSSQMSGMYMVKLTSDTATKTIKIIKE